MVGTGRHRSMEEMVSSIEASGAEIITVAIRRLPLDPDGRVDPDQPNLMDHLDEASLRRFTFKVKFDFMTQDQVEIAFQHFFKLDPPSEIAMVSNVTPGDFVVVRKKAEVLGILGQPMDLAAMLSSEADFKRPPLKVRGFSG